MAKIGTAHVEIKPVLNEDALEAITAAIEDAVARGVERGMAGANRPIAVTQNFTAAPKVIRDQAAHYAPGDK